MSIRKIYFAVVLLIGTLFLGLGSIAQASPVLDWVPPQGKIIFWWTEDGAALTFPEERENNTNQGKWENFGEPPANATDWRQWTEDKDGKRSDVMGGNIKKGSDWEWHLLSALPDIDWRIPDLIAVGPSLTTLYTAVNLDLYLSNNPWPALSPGDLLSIVNGELSGLQGIYWSSTEFTFDATSTNGFIGTAFTGDAAVQNFHTNVSEPPIALILLFGLLLFGKHKVQRLMLCERIP